MDVNYLLTEDEEFLLEAEAKYGARALTAEVSELCSVTIDVRLKSKKNRKKRLSALE